MSDGAAGATVSLVSLTGVCVLVAVAAFVTRYVGPRFEAFCARHPNRLVAALATAEDARLPLEAKERARRLFLNKLNSRQRRSWLVRRRFSVTSSTGRRYTIGAYRPFNIHAGDAVFCLQIHGAIPVYDKLLAQKLLIECDELLFLAKTNVRTFSPVWHAQIEAARRI